MFISFPFFLISSIVPSLSFFLPVTFLPVILFFFLSFFLSFVVLLLNSRSISTLYIDQGTSLSTKLVIYPSNINVIHAYATDGPKYDLRSNFHFFKLFHALNWSVSHFYVWPKLEYLKSSHNLSKILEVTWKSLLLTMLKSFYVFVYKKVKCKKNTISLSNDRLQTR